MHHKLTSKLYHSGITSDIMAYSSNTIMLVGYLDQGNLGLGYLSSILIDHGYNVIIIDVRQRYNSIHKKIEECKPLLIGFSLIFQYYFPRFKQLITYLRTRGIGCHMTIGGHYPSLRYEETLRVIPELDSVVLFEGESTLLELTENIAKGRDWHDTHGIAYYSDFEIRANPLRSLISDLDRLPFPHRPLEPMKKLGKKVLPILASRGCSRNCAFCSIREFYSRAPGRLVRRRSPTNVVKEIKLHHEKKNVAIFLFQDDDFPILGKAGRRWTYDFIKELDREQLIGKVIWKISCRADEVDKNLFTDMRDAGLYLVYLGIESGTKVGLKTLNKQVSVKQNLFAVITLKEIDLLFGYGFMLFDPSSTFKSIRANIMFLRQIVGDGSAAAVFGRMLPYAGTSIEKDLAKAGRLRGTISQPDYNFLDPAITVYYNKLHNLFCSWISGPDSVSNQLDTALSEIAIIKRLFTKIKGMEDYERSIRNIVQKSNGLIFDAVEESAKSFERNCTFPLASDGFRKERLKIVKTMLQYRNQFVSDNLEDLSAQITC